jgi:signal transduction histidine kinase
MLRGNLANLTHFLTEDPKGKLVLEYLDALASREAEHQQRLLDELGVMAKHIAHIDEIVATQQSYATTIAVTEELAPADVWDDAVRLNAAALSRHGVKVVRDFAAAPKIVVQKGKLLQILVNLVQNAKNACGEAPSVTAKTVTLRMVPVGDGVDFSITDNGVGIAAENLTRVFQQGFTTRRTGHGFGLHSCAVLAQQMGGALTAESGGHLMGATFRLHLPLRPPEGKPTLQVPVPVEADLHAVPEARYVDRTPGYTI